MASMVLNSRPYRAAILATIATGALAASPLWAEDPPPPPVLSGFIRVDRSEPPEGYSANPDHPVYEPHPAAFTIVPPDPPFPPEHRLGWVLPGSFSGKTGNSPEPQLFTVAPFVPGKRLVASNLQMAGVYTVTPYFAANKKITCNDGSCSGSFNTTVYAKWGNVAGQLVLTDGTPVWASVAISAKAAQAIPPGGEVRFRPQSTWTTTTLRKFDFRGTSELMWEGNSQGCNTATYVCVPIPFNPGNHWALPVLGDGGVDANQPLTVSNAAGKFKWEISVGGRGARTVDVTSSQATNVTLSLTMKELNDFLNSYDNPDNRPPEDDPRCTGGGGGGPLASGPHPVSIITGNVFLDEVDAVLPGLYDDLVLSRSYNSLGGTPGLFGVNWRSSFEIRLVPMSDFVIKVWEANGVASYFTDPDGNGTFTPFGVPRPVATITRASDGSYVRTFRTGEKEEFSSGGTLRRKLDRLDRATSFFYDTNGRLDHVDSPEGRQLRFEYGCNASGGDCGLRRLLGPEGLIAEYEPSFLGTPNGATTRLTGVRYADGTGYRYTYDAAGRMLTRTDRAGLPLDRHGYDNSGKAVWSDLAAGQEHYKYVYEHGKTTVTDGTGNVSTFIWEQKGTGRFVTKISGCGFCGSALGERIWERDNEGRITRFVDADGKETLYTYVDDNLASERNPLHQTTTYENYDAFGRPGKITVPGRGATTITYVPEGVETVRLPGGQTTTYTYENHKLSSISTSEGTTYGVEINDKGERLSFTDSRGKVWRYTYDRAGRRKTATDPLNKTFSFQYDVMGRPLSITRPDSEKTMFAYDPSGRPVSAKDAMGKTVRYGYDAFHRLTSSVDPLGGQTRFGYDSLSSLTSLVDAKDQRTKFEYDEVGRVHKMTDPLNGFEKHTYTQGGRPYTHTDRNDVTTTYGYDDLGRLTSEIFSDGTHSVAIDYDDANRTVTAANGTDTVTWTYDVDGRPLSEASAKNGSTVSYSYNDDHQRTEVKLNGSLFATYTYDHGFLKTIASGGTFTFDYDDAGRRQSLAFPNGVTTTYSYNPTAGWLERIEATKGTTTIIDFNYTHDAVGNRLTKSTPDWTETYGYDAGYRLTSAKRTGASPENFGFTYDAVGNRLSDQTDGVPRAYTHDARNRLLTARGAGTLRVEGMTSEPSNVTVAGQPAQMLPGDTFAADVPATSGDNTIAVQATDASGNPRTSTYRITTSANATYDHDANGNLTRKVEGSDTWIYTWNALNQLVRVTKNGDEVARFSYDPIGRRVEKVSGSVTTNYVYDGIDILQQVVNDGTTTTIYRFVHGPGIDAHLSKRNVVAGTTEYLHADSLGSIAATTDAAGVLASTIGYDVWGNIEGRTPEPYGFTGREWDPETGLYYYRARYYAPDVGRFLSEDPVGFRGGVNVYAFVGNNPARWTDPLGLLVVEDGPQTYGPFIVPSPTPTPPPAPKPLPTAAKPNPSVTPKAGFDWKGFANCTATTLGDINMNESPCVPEPQGDKETPGSCLATNAFIAACRCLLK